MLFIIILARLDQVFFDVMLITADCQANLSVTFEQFPTKYDLWCVWSDLITVLKVSSLFVRHNHFLYLSHNRFVNLH